MSKILDALEKRSASRNIPIVGMHDELAKTYFRAPQKKAAKKNPRWKDMLPWAIASAAVAISLIVFISRSSIDIKVRLLGEIPAFKGAGEQKSVEKGEFIVSGGQPQTGIVKYAYFAGDARLFSAANEEEIILRNAQGTGWANYTLEFKEPVDLNKLDIRYTAKGERGGECLMLVISDNNNRSYRVEKDIFSILTNDWKEYVLNLRYIRKAIDLSSIRSIKFEFGSLTAGNYYGASIKLKDICLTKTRRLKWL